MSPDGLNCSSKQSEWCWLSTNKTLQKAYSHLELTICCFKVQMFIIRAQYLLFYLPDTQKQKKSCEKNNIHRKAGQTAVQPVDSCFLPGRFRSGFWVANLWPSLSNGRCTALVSLEGCGLLWRVLFLGSIQRMHEFLVSCLTESVWQVGW